MLNPTSPVKQSLLCSCIYIETDKGPHIKVKTSAKFLFLDQFWQVVEVKYPHKIPVFKRLLVGESSQMVSNLWYGFCFQVNTSNTNYGIITKKLLICCVKKSYYKITSDKN